MLDGRRVIGDVGQVRGAGVEGYIRSHELTTTLGTVDRHWHALALRGVKAPHH